MTKEEISKAQEAITELLYIEANTRYDNPELAEKCRFTRSVIFKMLNNMNYRVSVLDVDNVHIFKERK